MQKFKSKKTSYNKKRRWLPRYKRPVRKSNRRSISNFGENFRRLPLQGTRARGDVFLPLVAANMVYYLQFSWRTGNMMLISKAAKGE